MERFKNSEIMMIQQLMPLLEKMNSEDIIKGLNDPLKTDKALSEYIQDKASEHLNSQNGMVEDSIVVNWAVEYLMRDEQKIIDAEKEKSQKDKTKKTNKPKVEKSEPKVDVIDEEKPVIVINEPGKNEVQKETLRDKINNNLDNSLLGRTFTIKQLPFKIGITPENIEKYLSDEEQFKNFTPDNIEKMLIFLGIDND